jgi:uncharacterized membrane-anchored protein
MVRELVFMLIGAGGACLAIAAFSALSRRRGEECEDCPLGAESSHLGPGCGQIEAERERRQQWRDGPISPSFGRR